MLATIDHAGIEWRPMLTIRHLKGDFRRPDLPNNRTIVVVEDGPLRRLAEHDRLQLPQQET
jgi:hypothetical protein